MEVAADVANSASDLESVTFDDALALAIAGLDPLRASVDAVKHGLRPPPAEQTLADARTLYEALLAAPIDPSLFPEGISAVAPSTNEKDHHPPTESGGEGKSASW